MEAPGLAVWSDCPGGPCWFDYRGGRIVVKNPDDVVMTKMQQIAAHLGARVQGEEGEYYDS